MSDEPNPCPTDHHAEFADGTYRFWATMRELKGFEGDDRSFASFYWHLSQSIGIDGDGNFVFTATSAPPVARIVEYIRLALIGGNHAVVGGETQEVGPNRAKQLVEQYCFPARPMEEAAALAFNIAHAAMYGNEHAKPSKTVQNIASKYPDLAEKIGLDRG